MEASGDWCLIESDPGVFTSLIQGFGINGIQVDELLSLDKESFEQIEPVYGLIFLFKFQHNKVQDGNVLVGGSKDVFFAQQVITNACATQAIINMLMNLEDIKEVQLSEELSNFKEFTSDFSSDNRGVALSNLPTIKEVHNSFSRQQIFEYDQNNDNKSAEDNYHFISYMPIKGRLYELDGLKPGPIDHGKISTRGWINDVTTVINKRIASYAADEINFNLMAVIGDQREITTNKIDVLNQKIQEATATTESPQDYVMQMQAQVSELQMKLRAEDEKRQRHECENVRRKHNYLPFIMEMLKVLAEQERLLPLIQQAKEKRKEKKKQKDQQQQEQDVAAVTKMQT